MSCHGAAASTTQTGPAGKHCEPDGGSGGRRPDHDVTEGPPHGECLPPEASVRLLKVRARPAGDGGSRVGEAVAQRYHALDPPDPPDQVAADGGGLGRALQPRAERPAIQSAVRPRCPPRDLRRIRRGVPRARVRQRLAEQAGDLRVGDLGEVCDGHAAASRGSHWLRDPGIDRAGPKPLVGEKAADVRRFHGLKQAASSGSLIRPAHDGLFPERRRDPVTERIAIVTGSARGIGAATARGWPRTGWRWRSWTWTRPRAPAR